uniref:Ovule protein n=1 Tax=Ascaris lumbricoides TaxID=6252 RepID=A0A0M3HVX4_ASCLU
MPCVFFSPNVYYENTINSVEDAAVSCVILVLQLFNSHVGILTRRKYFVRM